MWTRGVTRREFLRRGARLLAGLSLGQALAGRISGLPSMARAQEWPSAALAKGTNDDTAAALLKVALEGVGGIGRFVQPGQAVCIKPNCTWDYPPHTASSTDPDLLRALILLVREAGAKRIIVLDHPTMSSAASCLQTSGIGQILQELDVEQVFPDRTLAPSSTYTLVDLPNGKAFRKIGAIKAATEADVRINMAVAKSHVVLPVTLCLKHMMGFLEDPPGLHAGLEQGLVDINGDSAIHADLHILEAIRVRVRGMAAGKGTDITDPTKVKRFNQILAGTDPVLIDSYAVINFFGRQPKEIRYIRMAGEQGLGETDVAKATTEGRLRVFQTAGQAAAPEPPSPTSAASPTSATSRTETPTSSPSTSTPTAGPTSGPTGTPTVPAVQASTTPPPTRTGVPLPSTTAGPLAPAPSATQLPPTPLPSATPLPAPATYTSIPATNTPLPTATFDPAAGTALLDTLAGAGTAAGQAACPVEVVSPNAILNGALIPAAAVVAGAGLVVRRRLHGHEPWNPERPPENQGSQDGAGPPSADGGEGEDHDAG